MAARYTDYTGKKFRHLTMLHPTVGRGAGHHVKWLALCDCGTMKEVIGSEVARGSVGSCGKCEYSRRLMAGRTAHISGRGISQEATHRILYARHLKRYQDSALSPLEHANLIGSNCRLCGEKPSIVFSKSSLRHSAIDLIDTLGLYTVDNTIPCCYACKGIRGGRDLQSFLSHISRMLSYITTENNP